MAERTTIKDIDLGFDQLGRALKRDGFVEVGYFHGEKTYKSEDGKEQKDLAEIAIQNEFGTATIPERSFFRSSVNENEKQIMEYAAKERLRVADGKQSFDKFLTKTALYVRAIIQKKLKAAANWATPNASSTLAKKGAGKPPLEDTSFMVKNIDYKKKVTK